MDSADVFILMQRADEIRREARDGANLHLRLMDERARMIRHAKETVAELRSMSEASRQAANVGRCVGYSGPFVQPADFGQKGLCAQP